MPRDQGGNLVFHSSFWTILNLNSSVIKLMKICSRWSINVKDVNYMITCNNNHITKELFSLSMKCYHKYQASHVTTTIFSNFFFLSRWNVIIKLKPQGQFKQTLSRIRAYMKNQQRNKQIQRPCQKEIFNQLKKFTFYMLRTSKTKGSAERNSNWKKYLK